MELGLGFGLGLGLGFGLGLGLTRMKGGIQSELGSKNCCPPALGSALRVPRTKALLPCSSMQLAMPCAKSMFAYLAQG